MQNYKRTLLQVIKDNTFKILNSITTKIGIFVKRYHRLNDHSHLREFLLRKYDINLFIDVGANNGQTGMSVRKHNYTEKILSFEPGTLPFSLLSKASKNDSSWEALNFAVGEENKEESLNICSETQLNSFLPNKFVESSMFPGHQIVEKQLVNIKTLDSFLGNKINKNDRCYLKIDVQGFEEQVLQGGLTTLLQTYFVDIELCTVELYQNQPSVVKLLNILEQNGFKLLQIYRVSNDHSTGQTIVCDAIFYNSQLVQDYK